ncbi:hypothetical protein [Bdellovibrio bacteriovorus]|uniref:hypothetical protein n=1 Tax=Bdellovibrio bacteriovorus TaxID=959 RepID=UPI0035A69D06
MKVIFAVFCLFSCPAPASEGVISYGGDAVTAAFFEAANQVVHELQELPAPLLPKDRLVHEMKDLLKVLRVESKSERLFWNGSEVFAINYPEKKTILLSILRWNESIHRENLKKLVLHELLPLIGLSDTDYMTSMRLTEMVFYNGRGEYSLLLSSFLSTSENLNAFVPLARSYFQVYPHDGKFLETILDRFSQISSESHSAIEQIFIEYFKALPGKYCYYIQVAWTIKDAAASPHPLIKSLGKLGQQWHYQYCKSYRL